MLQLTYSDVAGMLHFSEQQGRLMQQLNISSDVELVNLVFRKIETTSDQSAIGRAIARGAVILAYSLLVEKSDPVKKTSRSGLAYFLSEEDFIPDDIEVRGLIDDHYILSLAVSEVARALNGSQSLSLPVISNEASVDLEDKLSNYLSERAEVEENFLSAVSAKLNTLNAVKPRNYLSDFTVEINQALNVLRNTESDETRTWIFAALKYFVEGPQRVEFSEAPLLARLDAWLALRISFSAVDITPSSVTSTLDLVVAKWPWLAWAVLTENDLVCEISEYLLANTSIVQAITEDLPPRKVVLALPAVGPMPALCAFFSCINIISDFLASTVESLPFSKGEKVRVDGKSIRVFEGIQEQHGQKFICLSRTRTKRGEEYKETVKWPKPEHNLGRLEPCDQDRTARGKVSYSRENTDTPFRTIDRLLHTHAPIQFSNLTHKALLVGSIKDNADLFLNLSLFGERLADVIPIAVYTREGEVRALSPKWRGVPPLLTLAADYTVACDSIHERDEGTLLVFADHNERLARQTAALHKFSGIAERALILVPEYFTEGVEQLRQLEFKPQIWTRDDLKRVKWLNSRNKSASRILQLEYIGNKAARADYAPILVHSSEAVEAYEWILKLRRLIDEDDPILEELGLLLARGRALFWQLLSHPTAVDDSDTIITEVNTCTEALLSPKFENYLSSEALDTLLVVADKLNSFLNSLKQGNPKTDWLKKFCLETESEKSIAIICRDINGKALLQNEIRSWPSCSEEIAVYALSQDLFAELLKKKHATLIVFGWFGRRFMPRILFQPLADSIKVLLYGFEAKNLEYIEKERNQMLCSSQTDTVLLDSSPPQVSLTTDNLRQKDSGVVSAYERPEDIDKILSDIRRRHALGADSKDDAPTIPARLFWFADESFAWLSHGYRAKRVNNLFERVTDSNSEPQLELAPRDDLEVGDKLLFHLGSEPDAIRVAADTILREVNEDPERLRREATRWKEALKYYASSKSLQVSELRDLLAELGSDRSTLTIRNWLTDEEMIAPREYKTDLTAIYKLAGLNESELNDCFYAIHTLRSVHHKASYELAERVIHLIQSNPEKAFPATQTTKLDDSFAIATIADADDDECDISIYSINRLTLYG